MSTYDVETIVRNARILGVPVVESAVYRGSWIIRNMQMEDFRSISNAKENPHLAEIQAWTPEQADLIKSIGLWQPRKNTRTMGKLAPAYYFDKVSTDHPIGQPVFFRGRVLTDKMLTALERLDTSNLLPDDQEYVEDTYTPLFRACLSLSESGLNPNGTWFGYQFSLIQEVTSQWRSTKATHVGWSVDLSMIELIEDWKRDGTILEPAVEQALSEHKRHLVGSYPLITTYEFSTDIPDGCNRIVVDLLQADHKHALREFCRAHECHVLTTRIVNDGRDKPATALFCIVTEIPNDRVLREIMDFVLTLRWRG